MARASSAVAVEVPATELLGEVELILSDRGSDISTFYPTHAAALKFEKLLQRLAEATPNDDMVLSVRKK